MAELERDGVRRVVPVGLVQPHAVPNDPGAPRLAPELPVAEYYRRLMEPDELAHEALQILLLWNAVPVKPADLVILAVSVVVSSLRVADFVSHEQHRPPL